jgi:hypothetical protein
VLVRNTKPLQLFADFIPNPATFAVTRIWIDDKQVHDDSPIYDGNANLAYFQSTED